MITSLYPGLEMRMKPDIDLLSRSYSSSNYEIEEGDALGRLFLDAGDLVKAKAYVDAQEAPVAVDPFSFLVNGYLITNLLFTAASFQLAEKSKLSPHFGDSFAIHYFGKSPVLLNVTGVLLNPYDDSHKAGLVSTYKYLFRLQAVAAAGTAPCISFLGYTSRGAMINLKLMESAEHTGVIQVSFDWMVFELHAMSADNKSVIAIDATTITDAYIGYC